MGVAQQRIECSVLWLSLVLALCIGSQHAGVSWDEVTYFDFSDNLRAWWRSGAPLDAAALEQAWGFDRYRNPHPPLMRALSAGSAAASGLPFPTNYRLATLSLCAGMVTGMYALLRGTLGRFGAFLSVLAVLLQPRVYGDVLNATCDAPVALAFALLCLLAWRCADAQPNARPALRALIYLTYGVATAIKFTGLLAIAPVVLYFAWRKAYREAAWAAGSVIWALVFLILTSPDRWDEPIAGVSTFLTYPFTRKTIPIVTFYLGERYPFHLPWHYFDVMTALTLPIPVLFALPWLALLAPRYRGLAGALLFPLSFWLVLVHLPNTPRHDGVRQFLAVMPLLGLLATLGFLSLIERVCARVPTKRAQVWSRTSLSAAALALVLGFVPWLRVPLSSYNALAGGLPGAEQMGLETTYFLEVVSPEFLARMNSVLSTGDTVMLLPPWPGLLRRYQAEGFLRRDVTVVDDLEQAPRYLLVVRRRGVIMDNVFLSLPAVLETSHDDVVLAKLTELGR